MPWLLLIYPAMPVGKRFLKFHPLGELVGGKYPHTTSPIPAGFALRNISSSEKYKKACKYMMVVRSKHQMVIHAKSFILVLATCAFYGNVQTTLAGGQVRNPVD